MLLSPLLILKTAGFVLEILNVATGVLLVPLKTFTKKVVVSGVER